MWMMGYNDAGDFQDPFNGRKLRPLMPRPATARPCLTRIHGADLLTLNHHLVRMGEENKREISSQVVVSSRWNPTPEQLQSLEELYRRGTRTPSAEQIQHITAELRRYGKIEGKNVFYWFQNHKARERQKRRRQQSLSGEKREAAAGPNKSAYEVEQTKNWPSPTNSSTLAEKSGVAEAECKAGDGWVQFEEDAELQRRRNATWRMMNLSSSPITSSSAAPTVTSPAIPPTVPTTLQFKPQDFFNIFLEPYHHHPHPHSGAAETLQLFPLRSNDNDEEQSGAATTTNPTHVTTPNYQFFEFLPLKN